MISGNHQQIPSSITSHSPSLVTRHTVEEAQAHTQIHILLAEDNVVNQKVTVRMLQKIGYRVDVVENGQEAVAAVDRTPNDLVLMNCQMPEMDGLETTRKIRNAENVKRKAKEKSSLAPFALNPHEHSRMPIIALIDNAVSGDRKPVLKQAWMIVLLNPQE